MFLLVGLGNPDKIHQENRHNIGHMFIDYLNESSLIPVEYKQKFSSLTNKISKQGEEFILLKPQTYMNLSGKAVLAAKQFYKLSNQQIIVIHDELDLEFNDIRAKFSGGNAGHNGLKDISQKIGNDYHRIRVGIGHPRNKKEIKQDVANYVLDDFNLEEKNYLDKIYQEIEILISNIVKNDK